MAKKAVIRQVAKKLKVQTIHIPQAISKAGRVINVARLFGCAISDTKAPEKLKSFLNFFESFDQPIRSNLRVGEALLIT